jgi:hypothetical protein
MVTKIKGQLEMYVFLFLIFFFKLIFKAKKPLRVFGDWSEFRSSTGKKI